MFSDTNIWYARVSCELASCPGTRRRQSHFTDGTFIPSTFHVAINGVCTEFQVVSTVQYFIVYTMDGFYSTHPKMSSNPRMLGNAFADNQYINGPMSIFAW